MAYLNNTTITEVDSLIPEIWSKMVYQEALANMYTEKFTGEEGSGMPIIRKVELLNSPGDAINISQLSNLSGSGVTGSSTLKGNEEKLSLNDIVVNPDFVRHAVSFDKRALKRSNTELRQKAYISLSNWLAKKKDNDAWTAMTGTGSVGFEASAIQVVYGNDATSVNTIDSADTFDTTAIKKGVTALEANDIPKVKIEGDEYYICLIHTYQKYSLQADSSWINAQQNANIRGKDNPLFTGALGTFGGALIYVTTQVPTATNANSPTCNYARAVMLGQEAVCVGEEERLEWKEEIEDYDFERGIGIETSYQYKVMTRNAVVQIVTAAVNPIS